MGREPGSSLFPVVLSGGTTDCSGFSQRLAQVTFYERKTSNGTRNDPDLNAMMLKKLKRNHDYDRYLTDMIVSI